MIDNLFRDKTILISGHTGFKGAWLSHILLHSGAHVVGVSLPPHTEPNAFTVLGIERQCKNYFFDIRDGERVKQVVRQEKPDIIFHLAAQPLVRASYDDPLTTYSTNVMGTANVLQAVRETPTVRSVVVITTDKVYENKEWVYPYREVDPLGGYDPYSASKAAADMVAMSYHQSFFNPAEYGVKHRTLIAIARAGNVIGGGDWAVDRLIPDIVRAVWAEDGRVALRHPRSIRPWQHVFEPLWGYLLLAQGLWAGRVEYTGAWNFGPAPAGVVSVEIIASAMLKHLGKGKIVVEDDGNMKHEGGLLQLDSTKARSVLEWQPVLSFAETVAWTIDWYRTCYERPEEIMNLSSKQIETFFQLVEQRSMDSR